MLHEVALKTFIITLFGGIFLCFFPSASWAQPVGWASPNAAYIPCKVQLDECTGDYHLDAGSVYMLHNTSSVGSGTVAYSEDSYHDGASGDCSLNFSAGTVTSGRDLIFYVGNVHFGSIATNYSGYLQVSFQVYEKSNSNCSGSSQLKGTDIASWTTSVGEGYQACGADSADDCSLPYGDPTSCHRPDVFIPRPPGQGTQNRCYELIVYSRACEDSTQQMCTSWTYDAGTVRIAWQ